MLLFSTACFFGGNVPFGIGDEAESCVNPISGEPEGVFAWLALRQHDVDKLRSRGRIWIGAPSFKYSEGGQVFSQMERSSYVECIVTLVEP